MPVKDILVYVDPSPACEARVWLAADLARRFDGYLTGIGPAEAAAVEERFMTWLRAANVPGEWRAAIGLAAVFVAHRARAADLVVLGQRDPEHPTGLDSPEDVILACGRPVLMVPYAEPFERIGQSALIAWNGSREATHAAHEALPLLTTPGVVTVFSVNPDPEDDWALGGDVVRHLIRHGFDTKSETTTTEVFTPSEAVLSRVRDVGADLLVMGAYGHSRLRETILGGMTRDVLRDMNVPVLMTH